ncbi:LPXTG cell wall anchor domain-containing protein [Leucobacter sp. L43]|uniref:DUF7507 domain-containing protein n=1 Tax=Leucobacter sp. L43 TaxID=2798040 RepID=UPI001907120F|nr:LPXTG cell wall anchor domain-containing protein [Leucobacter sp. L43]
MKNTATRGKRLSQLVAAIAFAALALPALAPPPPAHAAETMTSCSTADPGSGKYAETLCWIDFSGYDHYQAISSEGQRMSLPLPGGWSASFVLKTTGHPLHATPFPTDINAYFGNENYTGVAGSAALLQDDWNPLEKVDPIESTIAIENVVVSDASGTPVQGYSLVSADAETTDQQPDTGKKETITWRSSDPIYAISGDGDALGNACGGELIFDDPYTVICDGGDTKVELRTGAAIVASAASERMTQTFYAERGVEAGAFGFLISQVELSKQVESRYGDDNFTVNVSNADGNAIPATAETGPTGAFATTGRQNIPVKLGGSPADFSETSTGRLENYSASWACTRNGQEDTTLPVGTSGGYAQSIHVGLGDLVSCTITNAVKPAGIELEKFVDRITDVNANELHDIGDLIHYSFRVTNTGEIPVRNVLVNDAMLAESGIEVSCPIRALQPGEQLRCIATSGYAVTQDDQEAGRVANTAIATASPDGIPNDIESNEASTDTPLTAAQPAIELTKEVDQSTAAVGDTVNYTFTVTNTGNVPLWRAQITETDFTGSGEMSTITCPPGGFWPGESVRCTATYTITMDDAFAGRVTNTAVANASTSPSGAPEVTSPEDSAELEVPPNTSSFQPKLPMTGASAETIVLIIGATAVLGLLAAAWWMTRTRRRSE